MKLKKIKSVDSLEMKEIFSYIDKNRNKISNVIALHNINKKGKEELFKYNKIVNSNVNNHKNSLNNNSMKSLIKINELKNKKLIIQKNK